MRSVSPKSESAEVCLTDFDLRQISVIRNRNEAFAKKLINDQQRKISIEQRMILNQMKRQEKLKNLRYVQEDAKTELEEANEKVVAR